MTHTKRRIETILNDTALTESEKIALLQQLEADSRAKERGGTEGMPAPEEDYGEDLKAIEQALRKLGQEPSEPGAATL